MEPSAIYKPHSPYNPAGTPALEFRVQPFAQSDALRGLYVKSALFSGNRNQYLEDPTGFHFKFANSAVSASEVGYLVDAPKTGSQSRTQRPEKLWRRL